MDNTTHTKDGIIPLAEPQSLEAKKLQYEHDEKTKWRIDLISALGKAIALVLSALGGAIALCIVIYFKDREMLAIIAPIISGILAFVAARFC